MENIKDIFFDLDHTLWDFDKNSDLTFYKILEKNNINIDVLDFLDSYHPINRAYWNLYRVDKVTKSHLRFYRLYDTFKKLNFDISEQMINKLAIDYIEHLSDFNHLIPNTLLILDNLQSKYNMHIITNGFKEVQKLKLEKSNLSKYFGSNSFPFLCCFRCRYCNSWSPSICFSWLIQVQKYLFREDQILFKSPISQSIHVMSD